MNYGDGYYRLAPDRTVEPFQVKTEADLIEWAQGLGRPDWRVGWTQVAPGVTVSTIFLGLDHRHLGQGPPLVFETAVMDDYGTEIKQRWSTWDQAQAGHDQAVAELRAKFAPEMAPTAPPDEKGPAGPDGAKDA